MSMRATNTLCLCLDGIDSRRSEVYLLESPAKLIAQRTVYLQGEESVANCVNPIRKRAALINVARMTGATLGVALLGTFFALLHDSSAGFRAAMLTGGIVQLCGAGIAWATIRKSKPT